MRKFTKEISALLATVAMGTSMGAGVDPAENNFRTEGVATVPDSMIVTTEVTPFAGVMSEFDTTTTTTWNVIPPTSGTVVYTEPKITTTSRRTTTSAATTTTSTYPPMIGTWTTTSPTTTSTSSKIKTTTTTASNLPPTIGTETKPRTTTGTTILTTTTYTYTTTTFPPCEGVTMMSTTTTLPPLMGDIAAPDGDANGDGTFNVSDVVVFQKYLLNAPDIKLKKWYGADLNMDGEIDVFDLILMKRRLLNVSGVSPIQITMNDIIELSQKGKDLSLDDLKIFRYGRGETHDAVIYEYGIKYMSDRFHFRVSARDGKLLATRLESIKNKTHIDIRDGGVEQFIAENNPPE